MNVNSDDTALLSARVGRRSAKWALAYLRGRAAAYLRGSVTRANVTGCVELALRYGAALDDARQVLAEYGLVWDAEREDILRESTARESTVRERPATRPPHDRRDIQSTGPVAAQPVRKLA